MSGAPAVTTARTEYAPPTAAATDMATIPPWLWPASRTGSSGPIPDSRMASSTASVMSSASAARRRPLVVRSIVLTSLRPQSSVPGISITHARVPSGCVELLHGDHSLGRPRAERCGLAVVAAGHVVEDRRHVPRRGQLGRVGAQEQGGRARPAARVRTGCRRPSGTGRRVGICRPRRGRTDERAERQHLQLHATVRGERARQPPHESHGRRARSAGGTGSGRRNSADRTTLPSGHAARTAP